MTVRGMGIPKSYYIGLDTDTKPTMASHIGNAEPCPGSIFIECDLDGEALAYITPDGTNWIPLVNLAISV